MENNNYYVYGYFRTYDSKNGNRKCRTCFNLVEKIRYYKLKESKKKI